MATKAEKLVTRGLSAFEAAVADLEQAARLEAEEAERQRVVAREAALAAEAARVRGMHATERAQAIRSAIGI